MNKNQWPEELIKNEISGFLAFDNDLLMYRLFHQVRIAYTGENLVKPFTMFYTGSGSNFKQKDQNFLDKIFYERPNVPKTFNGYEYPKSYIGFQGIYNVFEYLLSRESDFADLIKKDKLYVPLEVIQTIADEMVWNLRNEQREKMDLSIIIFLL